MRETSSGLTKAEVLAEVRARGIDISESRFDRARKAGLLPTPKLGSLGRGGGRGRQAIYPASAVELCVAVVDQLNRRRSFNDALWSLWWEGYEVSMTRLRELLDKRLRELEEDRRQILVRLRTGNLTDLRGGIEKLAARRPSNEADRKFRSGFSRHGLEVLTAMVTEIELGIDQGEVDPVLERSLLDEVLAASVELDDGADLSMIGLFPDPAKALAWLSRVCNPHCVRSVFDASSNADLDEVRDGVRALNDRVESILGVARFLGLSVNRSAFQLDTEQVEEKCRFFLYWLSASQEEIVKQLTAQIMVLADAVRAGHSLRDDGGNIIVEKS